MGVFSYTATEADATLTHGTVLADSSRAARDELRGRGLSVHELHEQAVRTSRWSWRQISFVRRRRQAQVVAFVRELSTLLGVGMPLLEALDSVARQQKGPMHSLILSLRERVAAGVSLAEAMREQDQVFDNVTIRMTEVGESSGTLEAVLADLADFQEHWQQLRSKVGSALLYPAIVLVAGLGVTVFLMTRVVPGLLDTLVQANKPLPLVTRVVKTASDMLLVHGWWMVIVLIAAAVLAGLVVRTSRGRWLWHRAILRLPGVGDLVRRQAVVRIAFVVSTLMKSGIAFEQAVQTARRSVKNVVLAKALEDCDEAVRAGRDIAASLDRTGAFPETVVQVVALGQQSGRLEEMLDRLARDYDRQINTAATRLASVLEPILILALAVLVGIIAFATVLPILEVGHVL